MATPPAVPLAAADEAGTNTVPFPDRRAAHRAVPAEGKVLGLDELAALAERHHKAGRTVALAHGVFDLVHLGHVRHLESAARTADVLFVTVTADRFVNKGPGRPVFSARLRAEMLGALACVHAVAVNDAAGAEDVIHRIRPDAYVKGPDYRHDSDDITGRIRSEREAVERYGGRVVVTDDLVLSSSQLLNDHFSLLDPQVQTFLKGLRTGGALPQVLAAVESIADLRVLFVGEAIIDEYQYAHPMGKSAKENIIATRSAGTEVFAGGVIAAANHAANFCRQVDVVTCLGRQDSYEDDIREALAANVEAHFLYRGGVPTTRKVRFIDPSHMRKLFEVYHFDDRPIAGALEQEFCDLIRRKAPEYDVVVVTDFGHGMVTPGAVEALSRHANFLAVNAQTNSANLGYNLVTKYARADYVCIDAAEARLASYDRFGELSEIVENSLSQRIGCDRFVITDGPSGCIVYERGRGASRVPAFTKQVVDTIGAGDAFLAVTAPLASRGLDMDLVGTIGNAVGALKVGTVGHRQPVEKVPLMKYLTALLK